ncbi:MAG: indole-3-glycerol phosphate synthase TrpC [Eggerthellaceae bacterium]
MSILDTIAERTRERIAQERAVTPDEAIIEEARARATAELAEGPFAFPFEHALSQEAPSFICEVKKASPSKGIIDPVFDYLNIARDYERAGAQAISCLTEPYYFEGSNAYLKAIAQEVSIPILRKDFVVDARMVYEAKTLGASAVLLICSILNDDDLAKYLTLAHELGLSALVEAHDPDEIARAQAAGARIIGVNNRDLSTFEVNTENALALRSLVDEEVLFVSESGIKTPQNVADLARIGADAVLIGETLMRSPDKKSMLDHLKSALPTSDPRTSPNGDDE